MTNPIPASDNTLAAQLKAEQSYTKALIQTFPGGLFTVDPEGKIVLLNNEAEHLLGWSSSSCVGAKLHDLIDCQVEHVETGEDNCPIEQVLQTGKPAWSPLSHIKCRNEMLLPVEFKCVPIFSGHDLGAIFCFHDLSSQLRLQEDLQRLASVPEQNPNPVVEFDLNGNFIYANRVMMELLDGFGFNTLGFPRILPSEVPDIVKTCLKTGQSLHSVEVNVGGRLYEWTFFPIPDLGLMRGYGIDLTERQKAEEELKRAHDAAIETSRVRSEFLANVSHELRTPLNGIIGMTELTLSSDLSEEQREYLEMVKESADTLLSLINDTLDFAKIEAGKLILEQAPFALKQHVVETLKPLSLRAHQKDVDLICDIHCSVPNAVIGDPGKLQQILVNLVDNAIKFTQQGEIVIRVRALSSTDSKVYLRFSVTDTGIGIPSEKQKLIFKPFVQADGSSTRLFGGTGLGLAIVKQLVEMMDGDIWVESDGSNSGSTFYFTAHLGIDTSQPTLYDMQPNRFEALPILIIDRCQNRRRSLSTMLSYLGLGPTACSNFDEARLMIEHAGTCDEPFVLILLDDDMSQPYDSDLSNNPLSDEVGGKIPIILMTTRTRQWKRQWMGIGVDGILIKPVLPSDLAETMNRILNRTKAESAQVVKGKLFPDIPLNGYHILLVEDNVVNQKLAVRLLENQGHSVTVAGDGDAALVALGEQSFDLVLMDLQMPKMDGFEATSTIRRQETKNHHLPIIAMTAHTMQGDREKCLEAGMDDYISKPIQPQLLYAIIERTMRGSNKVDREPCVNSCDADVFDQHDLLQRVDGDKELVYELVQLFLQDAPLHMSTLELALENRDIEQLVQVAHTLKGSAGNLCANRLSKAAKQLELVCRKGDLKLAPSTFVQIQHEMGRLQTVLKEVIPNSS